MIEFYIVFCLTTSIVSIWELIIPALSTLKEIRPIHNMIDYIWISYIVFFLMILLLAPLIFLALIIPSFKKRFLDSFIESILQES